jgi:small ligand-binding sensory domain FIST
MSSAQPFLLGHARSRDWRQAAGQCLQQTGAAPPQANLGFLYVTDTLADQLPSILAWFRDKTGVRHWVGTVGVGICASGREYFQESAMAVMLCSLPADSFRILPFYNRAADRLPPELMDWANHSASHLAILHGDPANQSLPELLQQIAGELPGAYLVGGLSSSHGPHPQIADTLLDGGLSGVVFNDRVPVATGLTQGCSPIAGRHTITGCDNNILDSLDDRPALDVFNEDIGEILARDLNRAAGYIFASLPLPDSDRGDYLVRNLIGVDTTGKRIAIGDILHEGQKIQFCRRDGASAWEDMQRMLHELHERIDGPPRGGLYFSCLGRGPDLFGEDSAEVGMIRNILGEFPLVGMFANGEISRDQLYGYTGVLTLFL